MWLVTAHGRAAGGCVEGTDRNELICREEQFLFQREYRNLFEIHFGAGFVLQSDIAGLRSGAPIGVAGASTKQESAALEMTPNDSF